MGGEKDERGSLLIVGLCSPTPGRGRVPWRGGTGSRRGDEERGTPPGAGLCGVGCAEREKSLSGDETKVPGAAFVGGVVEKERLLSWSGGRLRFRVGIASGRGLASALSRKGRFPLVENGQLVPRWSVKSLSFFSPSLFPK